MGDPYSRSRFIIDSISCGAMAIVTAFACFFDPLGAALAGFFTGTVLMDIHRKVGNRLHFYETLLLEAKHHQEIKTLEAQNATPDD